LAWLINRAWMPCFSAESFAALPLWRPAAMSVIVCFISPRFTLILFPLLFIPHRYCHCCHRSIVITLVSLMFEFV
ncbi:MAG: hypothetical protein ACRDC0_06840, partial [Aeromonas veronii]